MSELRDKLVKAAIGEIGHAEPTGDDKYIQWYNAATGSKLALTVSWCAMFVSWCARQAGISDVLVQNYCSCTVGIGRFKDMGTWRDKDGYTPLPGDIIFFQYDTGKHTGIVEYVSGDTVYTIEGNTGDAVRRRSHKLGASYILGYACWDGADKEEESDMTKAEAKTIVKAKTGLSDETVKYIADYYAWGEKTIIALASAMK